jgi:hypothetical protein
LLVRGVLAAGGSSAAEADRCERLFCRFADQLRRSRTVSGDARGRARAIHEFMHAQILRGNYAVSASDLAATLQGGPYNCGTASALFLALAREFELQAHAVSVVGHVWCRVNEDQRPFDVETTCRQWFPLMEAAIAPGSSPPSPQWEEHTRRAERARVLDDRAFLAIFHYNRGVRMLRERQFALAAVENLTALGLDAACRPAYANLAASLSAWSQASSGQRRGVVFSSQR